MLTKAAQIDLLISNANPLYHRTAVNTEHRQTKTFISMAKTLKAFQPHSSLILPLSPSCVVSLSCRHFHYFYALKIEFHFRAGVSSLFHTFPNGIKSLANVVAVPRWTVLIKSLHTTFLACCVAILSTNRA